MPYVVVSDLHCHNWSTFSRTDPSGINNRLRIILDELERSAAHLVAAGGKIMVCPGDIFHVRGAIDPEVLNPTQRRIKKILDMGVEFLAIPGNHDLKGADAEWLGNGIQTLSETFSAEGVFRVFDKPELVFGNQPMAFVPWRSKTEDLLAEIEKLAKLAANDIGSFDLFIHAGIDGVLPGMPDHGLSDQKLAAFGFRHVIAGHFHNHKILQGGVVSAGATTHQTWGDVGAKAGFMLVEDDGTIVFNDTHAPKFVDLTGMTEDDMKLSADGNYVRYRGDAMSMREQEELRDFFVSSGARGVSIQVPKATVNQRTGAVSAKNGQTLDQSVNAYVDAATDIPAHIDRAAVKKRCADALNRARIVKEDA